MSNKPSTHSTHEEHRTHAPVVAPRSPARQGLLQKVGSRLALLAALGGSAPGCVVNPNDRADAHDTVSVSDASAGLPLDASSGSPIQLGQLCPDQSSLIQEFRALAPHVKSCVPCHKPGGIGESGWFYESDSDAAKLQASFNKVLPRAAKLASNGEPWMVAYAQEHVDDGMGGKHAGGKQTLSSEQIKALTDFHHHIVDPGTPGVLPPSRIVNQDCHAEKFTLSEEAFFQGVPMHSRDEVFAKFMRNVTGGMFQPTAPNIQDKETLKKYIRSATHQLGFYNWLRDKMNDRTLTRFYNNGSEARDLMATAYGGNWGGYNNAELAEGPGNLLAYIVRENRSIRELITAPYDVVPGAKPAAENPDENWAQRLQPVQIPNTYLTGLPSHPLWLGRAPTSDTNIGRHRSWKILKEFGDFDVLKMGGSQNVEAPKSMPNPTVNYGPCASCHVFLDPVAAGFLNYQGEKFKHQPKLLKEFLYVGYGPYKVPSDHPNRLGYVMAAMALDDKYLKATTKWAFSMLMERDPVEAPKAGEVDYDPKMRRFQVEDAFLTEMVQFLKTHGDNFGELIVEMAASRWYAVNGDPVPHVMSPDRAVELDQIGPGMISPETLAIRLRQLFGNEVYEVGIMKLVTGDFLTDLGGIDSKNVTVRNRDPNASNELVRTFISFEAGKLVVRDLAKPPAQRHLFNALDWGTGIVEAPIHPVTKQSIPGNEQKYRDAFVKIQAYAHGKYLKPDSPEINQEYQIWLALWDVIRLNPGSGKIASTHAVNGMDPSDPNGLVRAWEAYLSYIISGVKFNQP